MSPVVTSLSAVAPEAVVLTAAAAAAATTHDPPSSSAAILNVFTPTYTCLPYDMPNTNTNTNTQTHTANTQATSLSASEQKAIDTAWKHTAQELQNILDKYGGNGVPPPSVGHTPTYTPSPAPSHLTSNNSLADQEQEQINSPSNLSETEMHGNIVTGNNDQNLDEQQQQNNLNVENDYEVLTAEAEMANIQRSREQNTTSMQYNIRPPTNTSTGFQFGQTSHQPLPTNPTYRHPYMRLSAPYPGMPPTSHCPPYPHTHRHPRPTGRYPTPVTPILRPARYRQQMTSTPRANYHHSNVGYQNHSPANMHRPPLQILFMIKAIFGIDQI